MGVFSILDSGIWIGGCLIGMRSSGLAGFPEQMRLRIQSRGSINDVENRFPWHPWRGAGARPASIIRKFSSLSIQSKNQHTESKIGPSHV